MRRQKSLEFFRFVALQECPGLDPNSQSLGDAGLIDSDTRIAVVLRKDAFPSFEVLGGKRTDMWPVVVEAWRMLALVEAIVSRPPQFVAPNTENPKSPS
jgi:hypothetical protein